MASSLIVPPGGFAGFAQMTSASRRALTTNGMRGTRKRRTGKHKGTKKMRASGKRRNGKRKMKFGSPAWQKKYKVGKYRR